MELSLNDINDFLETKRKIKQEVINRAVDFLIARDGQVFTAYLDVSDKLEVTYYNKDIPLESFIRTDEEIEND